MSCALLLCLLAPALSSAAAEPVATAAPSDWVEVDGHRFQVEVARDDEQRSRGLMFRDRLADSNGMLFVFDVEQPLAFWMKNTRIPLDILYFDRTGSLVSIQANTPPCRTARCSVYPSSMPSQYVVELNAGTAERLGIVAGSRLCWSPQIGEPPAACRDH